MTEKRPHFLKRQGLPLILVIGLSSYVLIAGRAGTCQACVAITAALGIPLLTNVETQNQSANPAPEWTLTDLDGQTVHSADFAGQVVLVDFWATWCPPCRQMVPGMVEVQETYRDQGFRIVAVSLDQQGPEVVKAFNAQFNVNYTTVMGDQAIVEAFGSFQAIPTSFLINREGQIVSRHTGYVSKRQLASEIAPLL